MEIKLASQLVNELIEICYVQLKLPKNKKKIRYFKALVSNFIFSRLQPYLYTILAVLVLMFLMNCFQFYYYIKLFLKSQLNAEILNLPNYTFDTNP